MRDLASSPWWLPGGHAQTIVPALCARIQPWGTAPCAVQWSRNRWDTPDGDFMDVDTLCDATLAPHAPTLVLFHGLEGSSRSHYARAFAAWAQTHRWRLLVPHFRGCSGSLNRAPRAYHSGDHAEIDFILRRVRTQHPGVCCAAGVSLGGNALVRWAGEHGADAQSLVQAVAAICAPLDLTAAGNALGRGLNRQVYGRWFLHSMKAKARLKAVQHPGSFDLEAALAARDLAAFDDAFTAPLHGFKGVADYWQRASAKPHLPHVAVPTLLLNPRNDPFVPAFSLPTAKDVSTTVSLWQPAAGGHVGFAQGRWPPGHLMAMPEAVGRWLAQHALPPPPDGLGLGLGLGLHHAPSIAQKTQT